MKNLLLIISLLNFSLISCGNNSPENLPDKEKQNLDEVKKEENKNKIDDIMSKISGLKISELESYSYKSEDKMIEYKDKIINFFLLLKDNNIPVEILSEKDEGAFLDKCNIKRTFYKEYVQEHINFAGYEILSELRVLMQGPNKEIYRASAIGGFYSAVIDILKKNDIDFNYSIR